MTEHQMIPAKPPRIQHKTLTLADRREKLGKRLDKHHKAVASERFGLDVCRVCFFGLDSITNKHYPRTGSRRVLEWLYEHR